MVEKIKKQNEKADDLMEQQDDMIANYKVRSADCLLLCLVAPLCACPVAQSTAEHRSTGGASS